MTILRHIVAAMVLTTFVWAGDSNEMAQAIRDLGASEFKTREAASELLLKTGPSAVPALEEAAKSRDPEVSSRATELLKKLRSVPAPVAIEPIMDQRVILQQLFRSGPAELPKARALIAAEPDAQLRKSLIQSLHSRTRDLFADYAKRGEYAAAQELLADALADEDEESYRRYAVFLLVRGKLKAVIEAGKAPPRLLAYLYRAAGDLPHAKEAALKSGDVELLQGILAELKDWREVARLQAAKPPAEDEHLEAARLSLLAAFHHLAGQSNECAQALAALIKVDDQRKSQSCLSCEALAILRTPDEEGTRVENTRYPFARAEQWAFQGHLHEAFADIAPRVKRDDQFTRRCQIIEARLWLLAGEREKSLALTKKIEPIRDTDSELDPLLVDLGLLKAPPAPEVETPAMQLWKRAKNRLEAGQDAEARADQEMANVLALDSDFERFQLWSAARKFGWIDMARQQEEILLRCGPLFPNCDSVGALAIANSYAEADPFKAADLREYILLSELRAHVFNFPQDRGAWWQWQDNLLDPYRIHLYRAIGYARRSEFAHAMAEANRCLDFLPGSIEMPVALVPVLDTLDHKREADELFQKVAGFLQKLLAEFPKCEKARQDLDKLSDVCHRKP